MRSLTIILLCIAWSIGCADLRRQAEESQARRQAERDQRDADMQSLVGKKVVDISGPERPCVITFEDGSTISFGCIKYSLIIDVTKHTNESKQGED